MNQLMAASFIVSRLPTIVANADETARTRFLEFFAAQIRNRHTRRAYAQPKATAPHSYSTQSRPGVDV
jgi:integrase/recombinase XerC